MSDLISRSKLLKAFNNKNVQITFDLPVEEVLEEDVDLDDFAMLVQDAIQAYKKMVIDTIKNQPTAYDIEKVVDELKKSKAIGADCIGEGFECVPLFKAIEIVKQGGVSDDVCEWQSYCHLENNNPAEWLINPHKPKKIFSTDIKYCPYCGKKIKVVEWLKEARHCMEENRKAGYNHGFTDGFNKAVDDFVENISLEISESIIWGMLVDWNKHDNMNDTPDKIVDYIIETSMKIAKQLKAGGKNETN